MSMSNFVLAAGLVLSTCAVAAQEARPMPPPGARPAGGTVISVQPAGRPAAKPSRNAQRRGPRSGQEKISREDQRLLDRLENGPDFRELKRLYPAAVAAQSSDVRWALVAELEQQGEHGVNMLAALIADRNPEVADAAYSAWTSAVQEMNPRRRAEAFVEAGSVLSQMRMPPAAQPVAVQPVGMAPMAPVVPVHPQPVR